MNRDASENPAASRLRGFSSDNYAGICPEAWAALEQANRGHVAAYGDDPWTARAADALRDLFETSCEVFFVFNGTAANALALAHLCRSYHSVICASSAHIETDECGAPEFLASGTKILHVESPLGKLDPARIGRLVTARQDIHYPKPRVLSVSQSTEYGTIYSVDELHAVRAAAERHGLRVHMDGARFANAVAALGVAPKAISWQAGVDVLCLGCTKIGALAGDVVVFFDRELAAEFDYRCKQAGQLASKMRFLAAPLVGLLNDGTWLKHAAHANAMAARLAVQLAAAPGIEIAYPPQANAVFLRLPAAVSAQLRERGWHLYAFIGGATRCMCAWDTAPEDVDALARDVLDAARAYDGEDRSGDLK